MTRLKKYHSIEKNQDNEISLYGKGAITQKCLNENMKKLKLAFPELDTDWFKILKDRIKANNFTDKRLTDAVNYCIDTFVSGKTPHIANIITFDKNIVVYSYNEMLNKINNESLSTNDFVAINTGGDKPEWILKKYYDSQVFTKWNNKN